MTASRPELFSLASPSSTTHRENRAHARIDGEALHDRLFRISIACPHGGAHTDDGIRRELRRPGGENLCDLLTKCGDEDVFEHARFAGRRS